MKKILALLLMIITMSVNAFADMKIWHPYVPMKEAFDVDMDYVNEPVLYYTDKPSKEGFYYVGIYEGLTRSATLLRYRNKRDAYRMFNCIMQVAYKNIELYPVTAVELAKTYGTSVESKIEEAKKKRYRATIEIIKRYIEYGDYEENIIVSLPMNGGYTIYENAICNIADDDTPLWDTVNDFLKEMYPKIKNKNKEILEEYS